MGKTRSPFLGAGRRCSASNLLFPFILGCAPERPSDVLAPTVERGLLPDCSQAALAELDGIRATAAGRSEGTRDMRNLPWASIDNDDSRDLDQLTVAETMREGAVKILVAIADVGAIVRQCKAIDDHARQHTTPGYTAAEIFPMLPEKLSTDLTSLGYREDRPAIVIEMVFGQEGSLRSSASYRPTAASR